MRNLFANGHLVPWPGSSNHNGFLTYKNCPNLINLGLSPSATEKDIPVIFEKIITCANFCSYSASSQSEEQNSIYINAYLELIEYLRHLFIWNDSKFKISKEKKKASSWAWLKYLQKANNEYDKISIFTLNYDTFLERILTKNNIEFEIDQISPAVGKKIIIYKPHGSISFVSTRLMTTTPDYRIGYNFKDPLTPNQIKIEYENLNQYHLINTIIPPYGDSSRYGHSWSRLMLESAATSAETATDVVISGISYWHVDRAEIDKILLSIPSKANITCINPSINPVFQAVLQSRFAKFQHYLSSSLLKGM
ncbi:SIR2 family protein [Aquitalea aquatilis]|uniref:SIR2 family protein n=1 Tax=Aquitalea aquatilis TaxID=1537400 RepID=UPI00143DFB8D|nr:SIR2 family protein [Aquitalea aquatilis]